MDTEALHDIGYGMYVIGSKEDSKFDALVANAVFQITNNL